MKLSETVTSDMGINVLQAALESLTGGKDAITAALVTEQAEETAKKNQTA